MRVEGPLAGRVAIVTGGSRATLLLIKAFAAQHEDARAGGRVLLFTSGQYHGAMAEELPYIG